ncbi:hypothetical protein GC163_13215 [bacterium]|nr:hypothetical protein [bacterium]
MAPNTPTIELPTDAAAIREGCFLDLSYGEYVCEVVESICTLTTGKFQGQPITLLPWQRRLIHTLYGWRTKGNRRRFTTAHVWIPRKNGKTELAAALTLYHLLFDHEANPNIYFAASSIDQANLAYLATTNFILNNADIRKATWLRRHIKRIEIVRNGTYPAGGFCQVLSGSGRAKQGLNCSFAVADEVAEWGNRELYDAIKLSMAARSEPLMLTISTAGYDKSGIGIGYELYRYSKRIQSGEIIDDYRTLPVIYEAPEESDWTDLEECKSCNPSFGHITQPEFYTQLLTEAKNEPMKEAAYRTFHLNQWVGNAKTWLPSLWWSKCADTFTADDFDGQPCVIGVDLSMRHDLTAYVCLFERNGHYYALPRFFIPETSAQEQQIRSKIPYLSWSKADQITLTPGESIFYRAVKESLEDDLSRFDVLELRFDPYGAKALIESIEQDHIVSCVEVRQSRPHMSPATVEFYNWIKEGVFHHPNNPVLNWNAQNAVAREDNLGRPLVEKGKCLQRVDGITASIIAATYHTRYQDDEPARYLVV